MKGKYPRKAKYGPRTKNLLERDSLFISPSYTRDYPFIVAGGHGREVIDVEGNYYLDFGAGIATTSTGHCHRDIVRAIADQASKLIHMSGTDFYYESQIALAEKMSTLVDENDVMCFFGNSGAEANEAAMKLARYVTGRPNFIAFSGAFHGRTLGALSLTGSKAIQKEDFYPLQPVCHIPYPNCHSCPLGHKEPCKRPYSCLSWMENVLESSWPGRNVAACFVEALQGEGGYIVPPQLWLKDLQTLLDKYAILLVIDEVQSGMGRTGKWFCHSHYSVEPDIITVAKGIASGMPLGIMMATNGLMSDWQPGCHASTFGGNPISCAAALKTIEVIEKEKMLDNVVAQGHYMHNLLWEAKHNHEILDHPRGMGLMRAIDVKSASYRAEILQKCFEKGLILLGCGKSGIRFCPALNVTKEEIDACFSVFNEVVKTVQ